MSELAVLVSIAVLLLGILTSSIVGMYAILVRLGKLACCVRLGYDPFVIRDRLATKGGTKHMGKRTHLNGSMISPCLYQLPLHRHRTGWRSSRP